jgi:RsiW-degrading membrane proteinase PrsW (M82 family)
MGSRLYNDVATIPVTDSLMPLRLRSLIGTIVIICLVIVYALVATTFAASMLASSPWWVHLAYFIITGLLWILPAMLIIKWMAGPKRQR